MNYTVDDETAGLVAQALPRLQFLNLAKTDITSLGASALASLRELRVLNLG